MFPLVNGIAGIYQQQFYRLLNFFLFALLSKFHSNFAVCIYVTEGASSYLPKSVQLQNLLNAIWLILWKKRSQLLTQPVFI